MLLDFSTYEFPEQYAQPQTDFDKEVLAFLQKWRTQNHFQITTSGSTGIPKVITHRKEHMQNSAKMTGQFFDFQKGNSVLLCLPITKIGGMMLLVRAIVWRLKLYTLPPKLTVNLSDLPAIDFASLLPVQALNSFSQLSKIKTVLLGGAAVPQELFKKIQQHKSRFFHSYGMTETISHIAICDFQKEQNHYYVLPNVEIAVNTQNCLQISAEKLGIEKLQTNDIVKLTSKTSFEFLGRLDNVINSGGLKIIAEEIEEQIRPFISQNFYISGTADDILGEKVTLFIEDTAWAAEKLTTLKKQFQIICPKQAIPKEIWFQEKFDYTSTGKIKR